MALQISDTQANTVNMMNYSYAMPNIGGAPFRFEYEYTNADRVLQKLTIHLIDIIIKF